MAATRRTRAAVSLLVVGLAVSCCGCHRKTLRSEIAQSFPANIAPAVEAREPKSQRHSARIGRGGIARSTGRSDRKPAASAKRDGCRSARPGTRTSTNASCVTPRSTSLAHHRLAIIGDLSQDFAESERHYRAALLGRPGDATILNDLGYSYFLQKRFEESEQVLREAISVAGPTERTVANLALLYATLGDDSRAVDILMMAAPDRTTAENRLHRLVADLVRDSSSASMRRSYPRDGRSVPGPLSSRENRAADQFVVANAACAASRTHLPEIRPAGRTMTNDE